jgi:phosphatidylserine/phosphatidylglycerophosphate/cardiolipin synthase-like enzyme
MHKHEIMNGYIRAIEHSQRFVYIETQFFVTWCGWQWGQRLVENAIGLALLRRVWDAVQVRCGGVGVAPR